MRPMTRSTTLPMTRCGRTLAASGAVAALLAVAGAPLGCKRVSTRPLHVYVGIDASGSARDRLGVYALVTATLAERLVSGQDRLTLYRFETNCREFSDGETIGDAEGTLKMLQRELMKPGARQGTLPENFWKQALERVKAASAGEDALLVLLTDGENSDMRASSEAAIRRVARALAGNRRVRGVLMCSVRALHAERLRHTLSPLGQRLQLIGESETDPERVAARVAQLRSSATP